MRLAHFFRRLSKAKAPHAATCLSDFFSERSIGEYCLNEAVIAEFYDAEFDGMDGDLDFASRFAMFAISFAMLSARRPVYIVHEFDNLDEALSATTTDNTVMNMKVAASRLFKARKGVATTAENLFRPHAQKVDTLVIFAHKLTGLRMAEVFALLSTGQHTDHTDVLLLGGSPAIHDYFARILKSLAPLGPPQSLCLERAGAPALSLLLARL